MFIANDMRILWCEVLCLRLGYNNHFIVIYKLFINHWQVMFDIILILMLLK